MGENSDQKALRLWITAGLGIPEVASLYGDARYLIGNMVAKYTLAADSYKISVAAANRFAQMNVDLTTTWPRSKFYGTGSPFKYEHVIPAAIIRKALLECDGAESTVKEILQQSGFVAVLLRDEDDKLRSAGLNARMPGSWQIGDDPMARYNAVGIEISNLVLRVRGAIVR